jgi:hypothetical protein
MRRIDRKERQNAAKEKYDGGDRGKMLSTIE